MRVPLPLHDGDSAAKQHARAGETRRRKRVEVGRCFRCGAPGATRCEIGTPAFEARFCPACQKATGAKPPRTATVEASLRLPPLPPRVPVRMEHDDFVRYCESLVGEKRADLAIDREP